MKHVFNFLDLLRTGRPNAKAAERYAAMADLANLTPQEGQIGAAAAAGALNAVTTSPPGSVFFLAAPESAGHRDGVRELLRRMGAGLPAGRTAVVVFDAATEQLVALSLAADDAAALVQGVSEAVEMLAITLPAAFESDSYMVARMALDEELRSGHDTAIDALKSRAASANIGLLHTPHGYAVAPIHDGRVVSPEVVKALPEALRAEVDNKLASFEAELNRALAARAGLQQAHATARRDLDRDTAALAVRAALSRLFARFATQPELKSYLEGLSADLIRNAALFLAPTGTAAPSRPRAPADLAADPRLARFRAALASPTTAPAMGIVRIRAFDRASLIGEIRKSPGSPATPACVEAGTLTRAGRGLALVAYGDLMADDACWPLLRQTLRAGTAVPMLEDGGRPRLSGLELPVACRILVTGTAAEFAQWCARDPAITGEVTFVPLFEASVPRSNETERTFAQHAAAIALDLGRTRLDGETLAALLDAHTEGRGKSARLSTDLVAVRAYLASLPPREASPAGENAPSAADANAEDAAADGPSFDHAEPIKDAA